MKITLKAARVNAGLTQEEAAERCHVSVQSLIKWEKGIVIPNFRTLTTLSEIYEIPQDNIFLPEKAT